MDAIKLNPLYQDSPDPQEILRQYRDSEPSGPLSTWIAQAELYAKQGAVNPHLLRHLVEHLHWFTRHERPLPYRVTKRVFDMLMAAHLLLLISPLLLVVAAAVRWTSRGPIIFKQIRIGYMGRPFIIYKFRTMAVDAPRVISFIEDRASKLARSQEEIRTTPIGRFLRRWSLDELPQLWNILKGDMSLVGPRPLTPCDSSTTPEAYLIRFVVRPGLTGLWQAQVPPVTSGGDKLRLDAQYAATCNWRLDLRLLAQTLRSVIARRHGA